MMMSDREIGRNENESRSCDHEPFVGSDASQQGTLARAVEGQVISVGSSSGGLGSQGKKRDGELIQPPPNQPNVCPHASSETGSICRHRCHKCGQVGHHRSQCTQPPGWNAGGVETKQPATSRPVRDHQNQGRKRAKGSFQTSPGQSKFRVTIPSELKENPSRPTASGNCFQCHQTGNICSSCAPPKTRPSTLITCFGCGGLGHVLRLCPNRRNRRSGSSSVQQPSTNQNLS